MLFKPLDLLCEKEIFIKLKDYRELVYLEPLFCKEKEAPLLKPFYLS